ncbi:fungal-specific transcription factor domain-containing protein [Xylaria scruposa]|nr:fungal-specific transcription factor domain-containing protein [Xylaria scruposa]
MNEMPVQPDGVAENRKPSIEDPTPASPASNSTKRFACNGCRDRKIRCDKQCPTCGRCAKLGLACHYSGRSKQGTSKMDLPKFLMTLDSRLKQAEAKLAVTPPLAHHQGASFPWRLDQGSSGSSSRQSDFQNEITSSQLQSENHWSLDFGNLGTLPESRIDAQGVAEWFDRTSPEIMDFDLDPFKSAMDLSLGQLTQEEKLAFGSDSLRFDVSVPSDYQATPPISPHLLSEFSKRYFEIFHPIMPIISQTRFQAEVAKSPSSTEAQVLLHAIGILGASTIPEHENYVQLCYDQTRRLLDEYGRQESGYHLTKLDNLQAYVLLAFFEFKRPNFARAWLTLGRAIGLAKILGLDRTEALPSLVTQWGLQDNTPAHVDDGTHEEERRRTFWALYILDGFASIRTNSGSAFEASISVPLPNPCESPDISAPGCHMPSLRQVFEISERPPLSTFAASVIMVSLYQRCFGHTQASIKESSYSFWETHYLISKEISYCRENLLSEHFTGSSSDHGLSITMRMHVDTVDIMLHDLALTKAQNSGLPAGIVTESLSKCSLAATDIVLTAEMGQRLAGHDLERFRQLDSFLVWPITTAIQACFRLLYSREADASLYIKQLRMLAAAMRDLINPDNIPMDLLKKVDDRVAEAGRPIRSENTYNGK